MIVEMWRHEDFFSIADTRWEQLLALARQHGWTPMGTTRPPLPEDFVALTQGAPESIAGTASIDHARESFSTTWRAAHVARGYGVPPYPKANYVCSVDALALSGALEGGLPQVEGFERERCAGKGITAPHVHDGLSVWLVTKAVAFFRGGGFMVGAAD